MNMLIAMAVLAESIGKAIGEEAAKDDKDGPELDRALGFINRVAEILREEGGKIEEPRKKKFRG